MKRPVLFAALLALALTVFSPARAADDPPALPPKNELHLYILAGQSNMVGLGFPRREQLQPLPQVLVVRARVRQGKDGSAPPLPDPFWQTWPAGRREGSRNNGPAWSFARTMAQADPDATIGLIEIAVSGSKIESWLPDGDFYPAALAAIRRAAEDGTLKAFLWHQGEANSGTANYDELFEKMIAAYRADLGVPDLPVIAGTVGASGKGGRVNACLAEAAERVPHMRVVSSVRTLADNVHYDTESQVVLGQRFACALLAMQGRPLKLEITTDTLPPGTAGTFYAAPLASRGGDGTIQTWSADGLPPTLKIDHAAILGALPPGPAQYRLTLRVADGTYRAERALTLAARAPAEPLALIPSEAFTVGARALLPDNAVLYTSGDVKWSSHDLAFLRFDLPENRPISKAVFRIFCETLPHGKPVTLAVSALKKPEWNLETVKHGKPDTYPESGRELGAVKVTESGRYYELDLTGALKAAPGVRALALRLEAVDGGVIPAVWGSNRSPRPPQLVLEN
jgi:hypothetical protein